MLKEKRHYISPNHSVIKDYAETMTTKEWKWHLLNEDCTVFFRGHLYRLVGKDIGFGVAEVKKSGEPI